MITFNQKSNQKSSLTKVLGLLEPERCLNLFVEVLSVRLKLRTGYIEMYSELWSKFNKAAKIAASNRRDITDKIESGVADTIKRNHFSLRPVLFVNLEREN